MPIDLPMSTEMAKRIARSRMDPPFLESQIVSPDEDDYEEAVYSLSGAFFKTVENSAFEHVKLEFTLAEATSQVAKTFKSRTMDENRIKSRADLASWVERTLEHESLGDWDQSKCEVWIVHNDQTQNHAVSSTAGMLMLPNGHLYDGSDYRGHLQVAPFGNRIALPVFTWLDYGAPGIGVFIDNTEMRQFQTKVPEGHVPAYQKIIQDIPDQEYETRVFDAFAELFQGAGFEVLGREYEPNGPTSFPDWRASIDSHICDIEVTRMLKGMLTPRLVTAQRKPLSGPTDLRVEKALANARFSELEIRSSITATLDDKSTKQRKFGSNEPCILIIANDYFSPMEARFRIWDDHDYSAFAGVFLANLDVVTGEFEFQNILAERRQDP